MNAQLLAYSLVAAGSAQSRDDGDKVYLLEVHDGELVEKEWVAGYATGETAIASDARDNTAASYLFLRADDARLVFFISTENRIECVAYYEDVNPDWQDTKLGEKASIVTSAESKLSALPTPDGAQVLAYEDTAGQLVLMVHPWEGDWAKITLPTVQSVSGTPLRLLYIDNSIHLFYAGQDGSIHALVQDATRQTWTDRTIEHTEFDGPLRNFDVTIVAESSGFQICFLVGDSLWLSNAEGKTLLGEVMGDGRLELVDKEQNGWFWCNWCLPPHYIYQRVPFW